MEEALKTSNRNSSWVQEVLKMVGVLTRRLEWCSILATECEYPATHHQTRLMRGFDYDS